MTRTIQYPSWCAASLIAAFIAAAASNGYAEEINRVEWSPGGGFVGDVWRFRCPAGGSVAAGVDTFGDVPTPDGAFESTLDPALEIYDGRGNLLAAGDDEAACSAPPQCGAGCPVVTVACGQGAANHTIVVRDAGVLLDCAGGGSYLLNVEVFNQSGRSLPPSRVALGGGEQRNLPQWLAASGLVGARGPLVNDGFVPTQFGGLAISQTTPPEPSTKLSK
jgi:hypothetical protein